eukprot:1993264-Pyramimonas_sp.AAC.1
MIGRPTYCCNLTTVNNTAAFSQDSSFFKLYIGCILAARASSLHRASTLQPCEADLSGAEVAA